MIAFELFTPIAFFISIITTFTWFFDKVDEAKDLEKPASKWQYETYRQEEEARNKQLPWEDYEAYVNWVEAEAPSHKRDIIIRSGLNVIAYTIPTIAILNGWFWLSVIVFFVELVLVVVNSELSYRYRFQDPASAPYAKRVRWTAILFFCMVQAFYISLVIYALG